MGMLDENATINGVAESECIDTRDCKTNAEYIALIRKTIRSQVGEPVALTTKSTNEVKRALQSIWDTACGNFDGFLFAASVHPDEQNNEIGMVDLNTHTSALGEATCFIQPIARFFVRNGLIDEFMTELAKEFMEECKNRKSSSRGENGNNGGNSGN